jgi:hypothetical protein
MTYCQKCGHPREVVIRVIVTNQLRHPIEQTWCINCITGKEEAP